MTLDRTIFAGQAFTFADRFHTCFIGRQVEGFKLFLTAPEGQSTGGGLQAVQHITLQDEIDNRTIVLGSAHGVEKRVQIRSYESIVQVFTKRFAGVAFPIPREEYDKLRESFIKFFEMLKFEVEFEAAPVDAAPAIESPPSPCPSPHPRQMAPQYARGPSQARKVPPSFSLGEFLSDLPKWYYFLGVLVLLLVVYGLFFMN